MPLARIPDSVGNRGDQRHRRLQIKTEGHRAVDTVTDVRPKAALDVERKAVPVDAEKQHKRGQSQSEPCHHRSDAGWLAGSWDTLTLYAAETDMARRRIDGLRMTRGRPIAPAII